MKTKDYKGITLIALIITIIILLILAGVSISMVVGDNGILSQAVNASTATDVADTKEQIQVALVGYLDSNGDYTLADVEQAVSDAGATLGEDGVTVTTAKGNIVDITDLINEASIELISTDESYVGYYADVDGDGSVDGIIYADLCIGGSGTWNGGGYSKYSYDTIENCKNYYISQENYDVYTDSYGKKGVIRVMSESTGADRFYVMALEDFDDSEYYWYYSAYGKLDNVVSTNTNDFGEGKSNTAKMVEAWNYRNYGSQNGGSDYTDLWGIIQDEYEDGWFVPSKAEWACFGNVFGINASNYNSIFGLQYAYWSSTQGLSNSSAYVAMFGYGYINSYTVTSHASVRLSTTF